MTLIGLTDGGRLLEIALDSSAFDGTWRLVTAFEARPEVRTQFEQHGRRRAWGGVPSERMNEREEFV